MDYNLAKYRFGITLELYPSLYRFGTDTTPPIYISSICEHAKEYFVREGVTLHFIKKNTYVCEQIFDANIIRGILAAYWDSVNYQCLEI